MIKFIEKQGLAITIILQTITLIFAIIYYFVQPEGWASQPPTIWSLVIIIIMAITFCMNIFNMLTVKRVEDKK